MGTKIMRNRMVLLGFMLVGLGSLTGCSPDAAKQPVSAQQNSTAFTTSNGLVEVPKAVPASNDTQVNGPEVNAADFGWQVGLYVKLDANKDWRCGGILIAKQWVLTAAHCLDEHEYKRDRQSETKEVRAINDKSKPVPSSSIVIFHGANRFGAGARLPIDHSWGVKLHENWKSDSQKPFSFDAALIKLAEPKSNVTTAPLRGTNLRLKSAIVSGWGHYGPNSGLSRNLRAAKVTIADPITCKQNLLQVDHNFVTETTLCAVSSNYDACSGDSGSPLVVGSRDRPQTVGVVSWGPNTQCGRPGPFGTLVGGYTSSWSIANWVRDTTGQSNTITNSDPAPSFEINPITSAPKE